MRTVASSLRSEKRVIASESVGRAFEAQPGLWRRFGVRGQESCVEDTARHLDFLAEAIEFGRVEMFNWYVRWAYGVLQHRGISTADVGQNLRCLAAALRARWPDPRGDLAATYVETAIKAAEHQHRRASPPLEGMAREYLAALLAGDKKKATRLAMGAVEGGMSIESMYLRVLQPVLREVGRLWETNQITVAQEHFCAATSGLVLSLLYPRLASSRDIGRSVVVACVEGEQHEIGQRMVADFFEMAGWNVYSTGASLPHGDLVKAVVSQRADVLAVSCTFAPHLHKVGALIEQVRRAPGCANLKVMVGGLAFGLAEGLWRQVGADGYCEDGASAPSVAARLLGTAQAADMQGRAGL